MKVWATIFKNNKRTSAYTATSILPDWQASFDECLYQICYHLDLQRPLLLPNNQRDLSDYFRTLLTQDCFIEPISFDHLELEIAHDEET
jgi:hypothetical protein